MRDFAARLIAHEAATGPSGSGASPAFAVSGRMGAHLTTLLGSGGHRALLMRALVLAGSEVGWLRQIKVAVDGTLEVPNPSDGLVDQEARLEGGVVLIAQLIGLLVAFIGERLTLQLVHEVWPKLPARELNFKI
jgi:hypothetical protein